MKFIPALVLFVALAACSDLERESTTRPPFYSADTVWVDSLMLTLTDDQKISQLVMIAVHSNLDQAYEDSIADLVATHELGGIIFFQGSPSNQVRLTNRMQQLSDVPLLVSMDAEWGLGMRLDSTISFPYQMTLGAIQNTEMIYNLGLEIGRQLKRMGVHVNFAPVADINNNPNNPVIGYRSFGEGKANVIDKSISYMKGLQDAGVLATAKHFPGHGDTDIDSHLALPVINHSKERLDSVELAPFQALIDQGVGSIMVAHMHIPALDSTESLPSTLSKPIVTDILKGKMNFEGLIFTDAMNMKGVTQSYPPGVVDTKALIAGNEGLLYTENVQKTIEEIRKAIVKGEITQREIDERCRKILLVKKWVGLDNFTPISQTNLLEELNSAHAQNLHQELYEAAITVLQPVSLDTSKSTAIISIGNSRITELQRKLSEQFSFDRFNFPLDGSHSQAADILEASKNHEQVIIVAQGLPMRASNSFGVSPRAISLINKLTDLHQPILVAFTNAYALDLFDVTPENTNGIILSYQETLLAQSVAADLLMSKIKAKGRLPVTINQHFKLNDGVQED